MGILKLDGVDGVAHNPKNTYTALANGTITKGQVVILETDGSESPDPDEYGYAGQVVLACDANSSPLACGVALTSATDGQRVTIQTGGLIDGVNGTSPTSAEAIALLDRVSASTSGQIRIYDSDSSTTEVLGVCIDAYSSGDTDGKFMMYDKGWFTN